MEILEGSFSKLRPIGAPGTGLNYVSTPRYKDTPEEGEITGGITIPEPQCSPITNCEDIYHPEAEQTNTEDEINVSFNFRTDVVQENECSDLYIREVERFVLKSSEIIQQKHGNAMNFSENVINICKKQDVWKKQSERSTQ